MLPLSLKGSNVDLMFFFGTVFALDEAALTLHCAIATVTLELVFRPLVLNCADPRFLFSVSGLSGPVQFLFLGLVVLNLVAGFPAIGLLMAVGIMIPPAATARFWANSIGRMPAVAATGAAVSSVAGQLAFCHAGLPPGPAFILAAGPLYLLSLLFGLSGCHAARYLPRDHLEA